MGTTEQPSQSDPLFTSPPITGEGELATYDLPAGLCMPGDVVVATLFVALAIDAGRNSLLLPDIQTHTNFVPDGAEVTFESAAGLLSYFWARVPSRFPAEALSWSWRGARSWALSVSVCRGLTQTDVPIRRASDGGILLIGPGNEDCVVQLPTVGTLLNLN